MFWLLLLQVTLIDTSPKPPQPCSGPALAWCDPADRGKPSALLTNSSWTPLADGAALSIAATASTYSFYGQLEDDNAVVRAELWRKGQISPEVTLTRSQLGKNSRFLVNTAFLPKGDSQWFIRVWDAFGNFTDSKTVTVTRK